MPSRRLTGAPAFWAVAAVYLLVLVSSGVPSPLYRVYQEEFGFSSGLLTVVFAVYALALLASLLVVGALSDHIGRRPVLVVGLVVQAAGMVLFLLADGVGWLLAARVVQGFATGAMTGAFGAALMDLQARDRPLAPVVNSATPGLGLAVGAVGAGLLVEFVPAPTEWVFGVLTALFLLFAVGVLLVLPESSPRRPGARASLRPTLTVPPPQRRPFLLVMPCLAATWAFGGLAASLGPSLSAEVFGIDDHFLGTLGVAAINGTGVIASLAMRNAAPRRSLLVGALVFATGVAGTVVSLLTAWTWLYFLTAVVSGWGFGAAFLGSVAVVTQDVAPGSRAGLMSALFTFGYVSFSVPAVAAGVASGRWGLAATAEVFGVVVVLSALVAVVGLLLQQRRTAAPSLARAPADTPA
ncbi:MFS transporter [Goekera deserti]|uniref:MFS transporter n=1 Tax=Goekera deserti TaxID=2497753 RepID=UPI001F326D2F|nr:MFS transporter [Goekera deserti]